MSQQLSVYLRPREGSMQPCRLFWLGTSMARQLDMFSYQEKFTVCPVKIIKKAISFIKDRINDEKTTKKRYKDTLRLKGKLNKDITEGDVWYYRDNIESCNEEIRLYKDVLHKLGFLLDINLSEYDLMYDNY